MSTKNIIKAALFTPTARGWGLPLLLWGPPGTGKSDMIEGIGDAFGLTTEVLSPGERGEGAFGVIPVPTRKDVLMPGDRAPTVVSAIEYPAPDWALDMLVRGSGIVFVDELTTAPPVIQPALLGLVQAKRIGGTQLPGGVRVIAAANPPEQAAAGWELPPPVANRLGHLEWDAPSVEAWSTWLLGNAQETAVQTPYRQEEERVHAAWTTAYAVAKGKVAAFIRSRASLLHAMPDVTNPQAARAWPSHRSWDNATRALAAATVHKLDMEETDMFVASYVGMPAYAEFLAFAKNFDLPDPVDLLEGRAQWKHDPRRLDKSFAVLSSCASVLVGEQQHTNFKKRTEAFWAITTDIGVETPDIIVPAIIAVKNTPAITSQRGISILSKIHPIITAAGYK